MECRRPTVRTSQPQGAARLASGPFTRGLLVKPNIAARQDLVKYPTPTPGSGVAFGSGAFGPALLFSGAQASGAFSYGGTPVSVFSGLTSLTAVVTFRAASLATLFRLLAVWGSGASDEQWILQVTATGAASYGGYQDGSNHYIKQTADGVIQAGKLTTIVAHWPGGNSLQCFVNGQEFPITVENWSAGTLSYLSTGASTGIFQVGIGGDGYPITGDIHDYAVLTGARTSADLRALSLNNWQLFAPRISLINDSVLVAGGGGSTGTLSVSLADATLSSTGTLLATGTLSVTLTNTTLASTGTILATGTLSVTLANAALTASGYEAITGTLNVLLDNSTISSSGVVAVNGTLSQNLVSALLASSGTTTGAVIGTLNLTLDTDVLSAIGQIRPISPEALVNITAGDQINGALRLLGVLAEGESPSADTANDALFALNQLIDSWNTERLSVFQTQDQTYTWPSNTLTQSLGPSGDFLGNRPVFFDDATYFRDASTGVSFGVKFINQQQYDGIAVKTVTSTYPQVIWVNMTYPNVQLTIYPVPTRPLEWHFVSVAELLNPPTLSTVLTLPPGYLRAFRYNLAVELASEFGVEPTAQVQRIAMISKRNLRRVNNPDDVASMPYPIIATRQKFNVYAGNY